MYTVNDLLVGAMAIMGETEGYKSGYLPFLVKLTNQLLVDCFEANNAARADKGKEPLTGVPLIKAEDDILEYEDAIILNVMNYGLAFWLLFQDDENDKANACNTVYEENKIKVAKAQYENVEDFYK